jgi:hypothetical protein
MTANRFTGFTVEKLPRKGVTVVPIIVWVTPPIVQESSLTTSSEVPSIRRLAKEVRYFPPVATSPEILAADVVSEIDGFMTSWWWMR